MFIWLKGLNDQKTKLNVEPSDSINDLKYKLFETLGIRRKDLSLIYANEQLHDGQKTLRECGIILGSTLYYIERLKGGGGVPVNFNSFEKPIQVGLTDEGPDWNTIRTGMNLEGRCNNSMCEAFNQKVYCQKGFGIFNINKESVTQNALCVEEQLLIAIMLFFGGACIQ